MKKLRRLQHRISHWFGWNQCTPLIDFCLCRRIVCKVTRLGCKCVTCGEEKWFA